MEWVGMSVDHFGGKSRPYLKNIKATPHYYTEVVCQAVPVAAQGCLPSAASVDAALTGCMHISCLCLQTKALFGAYHDTEAHHLHINHHPLAAVASKMLICIATEARMLKLLQTSWPPTSYNRTASNSFQQSCLPGDWQNW